MPLFRHILLTLLIRQTLALQPLTGTTSWRSQSTSSLSAFKTGQDRKDTVVAPAVIQEALQQKKQFVLSTSNSTLTGALSDLSNDYFQVEDEEVQDKGMSQMEGLLWKGSVVVLCALWASNFPTAKLIMAEPGVDSSLYALARFSVAALALAPFAIASTRRTNVDWETFRGAVVCGSWVSFGYLGQTLGLMSTTASKSCIICSLHCVFVAAVSEWMRADKAKKEPSSLLPNNGDFNFQRLIPAAIAVAGVAIVQSNGGASGGGAANIGDALSFAQPVGFGLGYLLLEDLMAKRPDAAVAVSAIKLAVVACFSLAMYEFLPLITGGGGGADTWSFAVPNISPILASPVAMGGILYTGLVTTALALWLESIAFSRVSAKDASLILTTEPLFAATLGAITLGETFGLTDYTGAFLIIGACVFSILMDSENRDETCKPDDEDCQLTRQIPFGGR